MDRLKRGVLSGAFAVVAVCSYACERSPEEQTSLFREAEQHYVRGEYEAALDDYQAFIERYPRHRLAETAKLRRESLNREVQSVMDRDEMPAPRHVAESSDEEPAPPTPTVEPSDDSPDAGEGE